MTTYTNESRPSISANEYDLQEVIQQYQSQPELLKLILTSKVEEDKRRAEEAKLRAKELDLYLQQPPSPRRSPSPEVIKQEEPKKMSYKVLPSLSSPKKARAAPYCVPQVLSPTYFNIQSRSYHSSISSTSSMSSLSEEEDERPLDDQHQQRRHSAAAAMLAMGSSLVNKSSSEQEDVANAYPSPLADYSDELSNKPRRRREMQAITKIVETREFPYVDDYFWKNNGNTVQKKTGCKSIYYKCSNSNKGCSVNKTVTAKPNGEYLIKYRGCHLQECGRVERIRDL